MKKLIFTFVFISILGIFQGNANEQTERTVVAVNGLNLRESPTLEAEVITSVPFLDRVTLLNEAVSETDTLGAVDFSDFIDGTFTDYIVGEWVKVQYHNKEGYVFNAYLMQEYLDEPLHSAESEYAIAFAGWDCVDNIHRNKDLQWKGLFQTSSGYEMRVVELEYYMDVDEMGAWYATITQSNDFPLFVIGAVADKFKSGAVKGTYFKDKWFLGHEQGVSTIENLTINFLENESFLTINEGNQQQKIALSEGVQIIWKGDLDGDGKDDYLFTAGEESNSVNLYLSSEAAEGELVKQVASYYPGYCC